MCSKQYPLSRISKIHPTVIPRCLLHLFSLAESVASYSRSKGKSVPNGKPPVHKNPVATARGSDKKGIAQTRYTKLRCLCKI